MPAAHPKTRSTLAATLVIVAAALPAQEPDSAGRFALDTFVGRFCAECHAADFPEADLDLVAATRDAAATDQETLLEIRDALASSEMPPREAKAQPAPAERRAALEWIAATLRAQAAERPIDPGRVTVRRLSRAEYANTVRDLLGVVVDVGGFPADDLGYGFDNIGDALSTSALHLDEYARAAERIAAAAFPDADPDEPWRRRYEAEALPIERGGGPVGEVAALSSHGHVEARARLPREGRYAVRVRAYGRQAGPDPARMTVRAARFERTYDVVQTAREPGVFEAEVDSPVRELLIRAAFINDYYRPEAEDPADRDRNLYIDWIEVEGPLDERLPTAAERRWLAADTGRGSTASRARRVLTPLLRLAWRRDVSRSDVAGFVRLVDDAVDAGETFAGGLRLAVQAMLLTPRFLFRIEEGGLGNDDRPDPIDGHERATRLAYFLWSSTPDRALLDVADAGGLDTVEDLRAAARRMLSDDRAAALSTNFAAQWLELRRLDEVQPDASLDAGWDAELAASMRRETELLFDHVRREELPVRRLLDAEYTFVDRRLAWHYGLPAPADEGFHRVGLDAGRRAGILGHASVLTVTSNPTRTSPVKRGKWVLENVLDDAPPPPPPGSDAFAGGEESVRTAADLRAQLAAHRADARCAVCHDRMDALGLSLENFDAVGRWRESDGGRPIDASGRLPDGTEFTGAADLRRRLAADPAFPRALAQRLFVYAVGRGMTAQDRLAVEAMMLQLPDDPTLADLVTGIVSLDAFHQRRVVPKR